MSHIIYSTEAVVLKTAEQGESNKLFWLFTKQFGLVLAHAQSVRAGHSKLKHELQLYNIVKVSLVRGREYWRIVNVSRTEILINTECSLKFLAEAADFLLRLIHGEGVHADIFQDLIAEQNIFRFKVRALLSLGYLSPAQISESDWDNKAKLADLIEIGFAHSQL